MNKYLEKHGVVAFIDILGYSSIIDEAEKNPESPILSQLDQCIKNTITVTDAFCSMVNNLMSPYSPSRFVYKQFSDTVIFSFDYQNETDDLILACFEIIVFAAIYQLSTLLQGFYVRGGIAAGFNYIEDNLIFSKALTKAYLFSKRQVKTFAFRRTAFSAW